MLISYNLRNSDNSYALSQCKFNVLSVHSITGVILLCNWHLYLLFVGVFFIHVCCVISTKDDDDEFAEHGTCKSPVAPCYRAVWVGIGGDDDRTLGRWPRTGLRPVEGIWVVWVHRLHSSWNSAHFTSPVLAITESLQEVAAYVRSARRYTTVIIVLKLLRYMHQASPRREPACCMGSHRIASAPGVTCHPAQQTFPPSKIFISPEWIYPVAKRTENNKSTNLTININSRHIPHGEVGDTWNYTK